MADMCEETQKMPDGDQLMCNYDKGHEGPHFDPFENMSWTPDPGSEERETLWLIESYVNGERIDNASHTSSDPVYVETLKDTQKGRPKSFSVRITEYTARSSRLYDGEA